MNPSAAQRSHGGRLLPVGLMSGVVFAFLFSSWPVVGIMASGSILWVDAKKRQARLSQADGLRVAAGWFLAVMLCNLLLNWDSFQAGFIAGWLAAP
jgi:hypothetical protein